MLPRTGDCPGALWPARIIRSAPAPKQPQPHFFGGCQPDSPL